MLDPRRTSLLAALLLGMTALGTAPAQVAAEQRADWIEVTTGDGTDYTVGYESAIRYADHTIVASGTELAEGDTAKLVQGQFGWLQGGAFQEHSPQPGMNVETGRIQVRPGLGWFLAIDRLATTSDSNLHDGTGAAVFLPSEGERMDVRLDWDAEPGCPADQTLHAWDGPGNGATRALLEVKFPPTEDQAHRQDILVVILKSNVTTAGCDVDVTFDFRLRFVSETSYPNPFQPNPTNLFETEAQKVQLSSGGTVQASADHRVSYVPVVPLNWICSQSDRPATADCTNQALRAAQDRGAPRNVVFPAADGSGFFALVSSPLLPGGWEGARTFIPAPTTPDPPHTKLARIDSVGEYSEIDWPS